MARGRVLLETQPVSPPARLNRLVISLASLVVVLYRLAAGDPGRYAAGEWAPDARRISPRLRIPFAHSRRVGKGDWHGRPMHTMFLADPAFLSLRLRGGIRSIGEHKGGGVVAGLGRGEYDMEVQQAASALKVLHDPMETQERRMEAHAICERIKNDDTLCILVARSLTSTSFPDPVRHFGFQLYDHAVEHRWSVLTQEMRGALKHDLLHIIASGTRGLEHEQRFILEKIAQAVVRMACYE